MAKKGSKSAPSQLQGNSVVEEEKHSSAQKNNSSEIDEIFSGKKRKIPEPQTTRKPGEDSTKTSEKAKKKKNKSKKKEKVSEDDAFVDLPPRPRKRTKDGLTIYTEEELQISKGDAGGTPLCPFDCSCCF